MFSLRKILLPIDFSDRCLGAARYAAPYLGNHFSSEVTLLHVVPPYLDFGAEELGLSLSGDWIEKRKSQAQRALDLFLSEELRQLSVKRVLAEGDAARHIVEYAHSQQTNLIMMPTHGHGPFRRLLLGSVTSKVLHDADCPVWTGVHANTDRPAEPMTLEHIVCAVDLERYSRNPLKWASSLANEFKAKLTVVHVVASLDWRTQSYYFTHEWRDYMMGKAKADIETLLQDVESRAAVVLEFGDIAESVCSAAERLKADLLVVGRGSAAGDSGRFRTQAYAIIRRSLCPVVSV
jgi:nucleotide-binding universal stress UspA family protein